MAYYTYILYSETLNRYYVGATQDISVRLDEHLWKHKGFTAKAKDWQLRYREEHPTRAEAYSRERQIKRWKSRVMIEKLIGEDR